MIASQNKYNSIVILIFLIINSINLASQESDNNTNTCYDPIISTIEILEAQRDPKCHATANRLEDFMFGTPLMFDAREKRIELQKQLVLDIWSLASANTSQENLTVDDINQASLSYVKTVTAEGELYLQLNNQKYLRISQTDLRQYGSIAYSLRAILSVQQDDLFGLNGIDLKSIDQTSINQLKAIVDIASLAALTLADIEARNKNVYEVDANLISNAWKQIVHSESVKKKLKKDQANPVRQPTAQNDLLLKTIDQKLSSYQQYNELSEKLFLRNIQVYFAKKQWPKSEKESELLVQSYQDALIQYGSELMKFSESLSDQNDDQIIRINHVNRAISAFLPYTINEFEDVTYFPLLAIEDQISIESYDLDAFRDSGLHWQIVKFILDDPEFKLMKEIDPYASELLVESIAQFGVLLWRVSGLLLEQQNSDQLSNASLLEAMDVIKNLTKKNNGRYGVDQSDSPIIASSEDDDASKIDIEFVDVTDTMRLSFEHRSADWLNRQLRSYVFQQDQNVARLSIPPAFGGAGVAAEDINGDGYDDLLLLSGSGNQLFLNKGGKEFIDITATSGMSNMRPDGTYDEPRQPIICDFNNDGYQDIFISYVNAQHQLYAGHGDGTFTDQSNTANLGGIGLVGGPATAADFNNDGLIDLYIGYFGNYLAGELPTLARNNVNGTPNVLWINKGDFQFVEATQLSGVDNKGWTQAVGHTDINNDGLQDLIVGNDFGNNGYYINDGDHTFTDNAVQLGTNKPSYTMNVGIADLNRDQYPDFYISNIVVMEKDDKYVLPNEETTMHFDPQSLATMRISEANDLFLSSVKQQDPVYSNSTLVDRGYAQTGWSWDADFFDYDNDGDEDLYVLNGMNPYSVYGQENAYYQNPDGQSADVIFAKSNAERNVFFRNENGRLKQHSKESGLDLLHTSRSATYTDYDLDGDLDIVLNNYHGQAYIYENKSETRGKNWVKIKLSSSGVKSSTDVIGAKIILSSKSNKNIWREVHSTDGYLSGHPKTVHFGLNNDEKCKVEIHWPSGEVTKHKLSEVNRTYLIHMNKDGVQIIS